MEDGLHIDKGGTQYWWKNGCWHRDDDLPAIICPSGTKEWYQNDLVHRDNDKPAIEYHNGTKEWFKHERKHRIGNPAVIFCDGGESFYLEGVKYTEEDYWKEIGKTYGLLICDKVKV